MLRKKSNLKISKVSDVIKFFLTEKIFPLILGGGGLTAIGDLFFKKATSHSLFDCQIIISTDSHLLLLQEAKEHERIGSVHCFASLGINLEVHTL